MHRTPGAAAAFRRDVLACAFTFCATLVVYIITLPPNLLPGDGGELIAASRTLSVAHPPGYPLYLMLGRIFSSVFAFGSVALRFNLMSAVLASAVAVMLYALARLLGAGRWVAVAVAAGLATRDAWWLQAVGAEVYTLNAVFVAALLLIALKGIRRGDRVIVLLGLAGGLAVSHHLSLVWTLAAAAIALIALGVKPRMGAVAMAALLFFAGLTVWLYIPVRAAQSPPLTWGDTAGFDGFLSHITAQGYRWRLKSLDPGARLVDFGAYVRLMFTQAGPWLSALAAIGLVVSLRKWRLLLGLLLVYVFYGVHLSAYNIPDIDGHVFPALVPLGALAALGADFLAGRLGRVRRAAGAAVLAAVSLIFVTNVISLDGRKDEWFANDYALAAVRSAVGPGARNPLVIGSGSALDFAALYMSLVEEAPVQVYIMGVSNPAAAGLPGSPRHMDECVEWALRDRDVSEIALIGPAPQVIAGHETEICGMVYALEGDGRDCTPPDRIEVRGHDGDDRDFNSRLLSGTYHLHIARWHVASGDTASARESIADAVRIAYDDVGTHIYASRLLLEMGSSRESFLMAEKAAEVDPDFFEAHDLLASLYFMGGNLDRAIAEYEMALDGNPNPAPVYSNLGNAYSKKRDYAQAMEYYREALRLDDATVNAHIGLGIAISQTGDVDLGIQHLRRARELQPRSPLPYHSEATVLMGLERYGQAMTVVESGLKAVPGDANLLSDKGLVLLRTGEPDSAVTYLGRALEANPDMLTARGNLAVAYERLGDEERAREHYHKYIQAAPPGPSRDRATAALRRLGG
ncbi:MAG: tetratricopeptide repeat protein [bacterium]|jgi:tetratricopeptide (TPR) repeat protein